MRVQQKQKKNARKRWNVTPYDRGGQSGGAGSNGFGIESVVNGSDSVDGFDGWVDAGIAWLYDWHQRTINRAYPLAKTANA